MHRLSSICIKSCYCYQDCPSLLRKRLGFCTSEELKKILEYMCLLRPHFFARLEFKRASSRPIPLLLKTLQSFHETEIDRVLWFIDTFYCSHDRMGCWNTLPITQPPESRTKPDPYHPPCTCGG